MDPHQVEISSVRDMDGRPDVNVQGFQLLDFELENHDIYDGHQRARFFDPAVAELVKRNTGAATARVFDPFLRGEEAQRRHPGSISAPAGAVHVDYTNESGYFWFEKILGNEASRWTGHRFAIINVWRPITGPLKDHPLALCDARTVDPQDLLVSKSYTRVAKDGLHSAGGEPFEGEIFSVAFNSKHRWYYVPEMRTDEALILKNFDSQLNGIARFSPHCAFKDPGVTGNVLPRASIEVRVLTVW
jgi:hypothetical protein